MAAPIFDNQIKDRIRRLFDTIMSDDEKGKELNSKGIYEDRSINPEPVDSQELLYQEAYNRRKEQLS